MARACRRPARERSPSSKPHIIFRVNPRRLSQRRTQEHAPVRRIDGRSRGSPAIGPVRSSSYNIVIADDVAQAIESTEGLSADQTPQKRGKWRREQREQTAARPGTDKTPAIRSPMSRAGPPKGLVDGRGFEPPTPALRTRCSPN
jgi:hypothetical protein